MIPAALKDVIGTDVSFLQVQKKALEMGILQSTSNYVITSPTGSGKTFIAEIAALETVLVRKKKAIFVVPLRALANEIYATMQEKYGEHCTIQMSLGDLENPDALLDFDILIITAEKLDFVIRKYHHFLDAVGLVVIDEVQLLHDERRGPTLEVLITFFKTFCKQVRIITLSSRLTNAYEIASWLSAVLVEDDWRPFTLRHGVLVDSQVKMYKEE